MTRCGRRVIDTLRRDIERVGWTTVASRTGIRRESLHRAFRAGRAEPPSFSTIMAVAQAVGRTLEVI